MFLNDPKAEEIWEAEGFSLHGKSRSKWLAYYMGIRSAVFDAWLGQQMAAAPDAVIIHIGCGMDSRILRIGAQNRKWYDVDFPEVIRERKRYFTETDDYNMIASDARDGAWLAAIKETKSAIVVMEGVSMYMPAKDMRALTDRLSAHFDHVVLLADAYTSFAANMSKCRNPINNVGVTDVYGIDDPREYRGASLIFTKEHAMTPQAYIDQLKGTEKFIFAKLYAGSFSQKL